MSAISNRYKDYHTTRNAAEEECTICLEDLEKDATAHTIPSSQKLLHPAHKKCIKTWAKLSDDLGNVKCPSCKVSTDTTSLFSTKELIVFNSKRLKSQITEAGRELAITAITAAASIMVTIGLREGIELLETPSGAGREINAIIMPIAKLILPLVLSEGAIYHLVSNEERTPGLSTGVISWGTAVAMFSQVPTQVPTIANAITSNVMPIAAIGTATIIALRQLGISARSILDSMGTRRRIIIGSVVGAMGGSIGGAVMLATKAGAVKSIITTVVMATLAEGARKIFSLYNTR